MGDTQKTTLFSFVILISTQIALGYGLTASVLFAMFFSLNIYCGAWLWQQITNRTGYEFTELIGIGIALGTIVPATINFVVRMVGVSGFSTAWIFPVLIFFWKSVMSRTKSVRQYPAIKLPAPSTMLWIVILPWFGLLAWGMYVMPICLVGVVLSLAFQTTRIKKVLRGSMTRQLSLASFLYLVAIIMNIFAEKISKKSPIRSSIYGVDTVIDESQSWGIAKYGLIDNVMFSGERTYQHVLTHAWAGDITSFVNGPGFMASGVLGFWIGLVGLSFLIFATSRRIGADTAGAICAVGVYFLTASMPEEITFVGPRMANSISMLWLLLLVVSSLELRKTKNKLVYLYLLVLVILVSIGKMHWGAYFAVGFFAVAVIECNQYSLFKRVGIGVVPFIVFAMTYRFIIGNAGSDHPTTPADSLQIGVGLLPLIASFILLRIFTVFKFIRKSENDDQHILIVFLSGTFILLPIIWVTSGGFLSAYWFFPILLLSSIFFGPYLPEILNNLGSVKIIWTIGIVSLILGTASMLSYLYANFRFIDAKRSDLFSFFIVKYPDTLTLIVAGFLTVLLLFIFSRMARRPTPHKAIKSICSIWVVVGISISIGVFAIQTQRNPILAKIYGDSVAKVDVITKTHLSVAQWINKNTSKDSLIATNYFCTDLASEFTNISTRSDLDCFTRNSLPWLSAFGHRKIYIEAPLFVGGLNINKLQSERYMDSISFASLQDEGSYKNLIQNDVGWFVLDRQQSSLKSFEQFARIRYQNADFLILELHKTK